MQVERLSENPLVERSMRAAWRWSFNQSVRMQLKLVAFNHRHRHRDDGHVYACRDDDHNRDGSAVPHSI